jgi:hypothetical protein
VEEELPLSVKLAGVESSSNLELQKSNPQESNTLREWEGGEGGSILLNLQTPLRSFPPFRFGYASYEKFSCCLAEVGLSHVQGICC